MKKRIIETDLGPFVAEGRVDSERFVWANGHGELLHAIVEPQIATQQDSFCGEPPHAGHWLRADHDTLTRIDKCSDCVEATRGMVDDSLTGIRWMEKQK